MGAGTVAALAEAMTCQFDTTLYVDERRGGPMFGLRKSASVVLRGRRIGFASRWREHGGPSGGYSVRLPERPQHLKFAFPVPGFGVAVVDRFGAVHETSPRGYFQVSTTDYPVGFLDQVTAERVYRTTLLEGGARLEEEREVALGRVTAYQFRTRLNVPGGCYRIGRFFVSGRRSWLIMATGGESVADPDIVTWLDTLRLR